MTAAHCLDDPAIFVSYFFVVPDEHDDNVGGRLQLADLLTSAYGEFATGGTAPSLWPRVELPQVGESRRLAHVQRHARGDDEIELEIRSLHDAVCLRAATLRRGRFSLADLLDVPKPHFASLDGIPARNLLGSFTATCAEADPAATDREIVDLAEKLAEARLPPTRSESDRFKFCTDVGPFIFAPLGDRLEAVFVYRRGAPVEFAFQITLQELVLCHLKVQNVRSNLTRWLAEAKEQDLKLRKLIQDSHPSRLKLRQLRQANDDLTTLRADLVGTLARIESELRTLDLSRDNFLKALQASPFQTAAPELTRDLIDRLAVPLKTQATADLGYRQATRERASVHFESLQATIDLHEADYTRLLAIVMAVLTCVQIASLLPVVFGGFGQLAWCYKLASVVGLSGTLALLVWFLIRSRD